MRLFLLLLQQRGDVIPRGDVDVVVRGVVVAYGNEAACGLGGSGAGLVGADDEELEGFDLGGWDVLLDDLGAAVATDAVDVLASKRPTPIPSLYGGA